MSKVFNLKILKTWKNLKVARSCDPDMYRQEIVLKKEINEF